MAEMEEYKNLEAKIEKEPLSYDELKRLNELHVFFIRKCYQVAISGESERRELNRDLDELTLINKVLVDYLEENGLLDEFQQYFDESLDRMEKEEPVYH